MDASTPPANRDVRSGAQPDQELESSCRCYQPEVSDFFVSHFSFTFDLDHLRMVHCAIEAYCNFQNPPQNFLMLNS